MNSILTHLRSGLAVLALCLITHNTPGASLWWDATPGTAGVQDGAGQWSTIGSNNRWWDGVGNAAWNNANSDTAIFGLNTATATTVTITNKVVAGGIIFSNVGAGAYTVAVTAPASLPQAAATNLTLTGTLPTITLAAHNSTNAQIVDVISASVIATGGLHVVANTTMTNGFVRLGNITNNIVGDLYVGTPGTASYGGTSAIYFDFNTPTTTDPYVSIINNLTNVTVYSNATFRISNHNSGSPANVLWPKKITLSGFGRNGLNGAWIITGNVGDNFATDLALAGDSLIDINAGAANKVFTLYGVISGSGNLSVVSANSAVNRHTLVLTNASTFAGNMNVGGGTTLQLISGDNRLPATTAVALGMSGMPVANWNAYGRLVLGNSSGAINQTIAGLSSDSAAPLCWAIGGNGSTVSMLTVNSVASNHFAGSFGGTAAADKNIGLILTGGGTLTLAGTNLANGGFTASSGTIEFGDGLMDLPLSGNITNNSSVVFNVAGSQGHSQLITGSGAVTKNGAGVLTLNGTNDYSGATVVSAGTLSITTAKSGTGAINVATGLELDLKRHAANGKITAATASFDATTVRLDFNLKGPNATPMLQVNGALNNTGTMNIHILNASALTVGSYPLIKYGSLVDGGGSAFNLANVISPRVSASIVNNTVTKTIELVVTAVDFLRWTGATDGTWDTTTTNWLLTSSSSPINYADGELVQLDDSGANSSITLVISAQPGMATVSNTTTPYTLAGGGGLSGGGTLIKSGSGSLTLAMSGGAAQSGGTFIQAGTVTLGEGPVDCTLTGPVENNGSLIVNVASANNLPAVSGTGPLTKNGVGELTLDEASSYSGATSITAGSVRVSDSAAFGTAVNGTTVQPGAEIVMDASGLNIPEPLTISGTGLGTAGALSLGDALSSTWSGKLTLTGDTLLTAGYNSVLTLGDGVAGGANTLTVAPRANGYVVLGGNVAASAVLLGTYAGDLAIGGLHLNGANASLTNVQVLSTTASGTPPVNAGLYARHNLALGTNSTVVLTNGQHIGDTGARLSLDGNVNIPADVKLAAYCPGEGFEGPGAYRCTLTVPTSTTNTWNGPIAIHGPDPSLGVTSSFLCYAGNSGSSGRLVLNGNVSIVDGPVVFFTRGYGSGLINGQLNLGTNLYSQTDGARWTITSTGNTWRETQLDSSATLALGANNALCVTAPVRFLANSALSVLELNGFSQTIAGLASPFLYGTIVNHSTSTHATLTFQAGTSWTFGGSLVLSGVVGSKQFGLDVTSGSLTLTATGNSYAGPTVIRSGATLALSTNVSGAGNGTIQTSDIEIQAGGTFNVTGRSDGTYNCPSGVVLSGSGSLVGSVTNHGTIAPGSSVGTLEVTSDVFLAADGTLRMEVNNATATNDRLNVGAAMTYGGSLVITNISATPYTNNQVIKLFDSATATYSGAFSTIVFPNVSAYDDSNLTVDGTIKVVSVMTPTPTNLTYSVVGGNTLQISWPANYTGWRLEGQTNNLNVGLSTTWFTVPGSTTTNEMYLPINRANPTVFYRLANP